MPRSDREYIKRHVEQAIAHIDKAGQQIAAALSYFLHTYSVDLDYVKSIVLENIDQIPENMRINMAIAKGLYEMMQSLGEDLKSLSALQAEI